jgi:hypothetical protein
MKRTSLPAPREFIEDGYSLVAEDPEDMVRRYYLNDPRSCILVYMERALLTLLITSGTLITSLLSAISFSPMPFEK